MILNSRSRSRFPSGFLSHQVDHFAVDDDRTVGVKAEPHTVAFDGQNAHFDFAGKEHLPAVLLQGGRDSDTVAILDGEEGPAVLYAADNDTLAPAVDVDLFAGLKS